MRSFLSPFFLKHFRDTLFSRITRRVTRESRRLHNIMTVLQTLLQQKQPDIAALARRYGVVSLKVFGSVARGDDKKESDVDFLVMLEPTRSLHDFTDFKMALESLLSRKVDVLFENKLHWFVRPAILKEARVIAL